MPDFPTLNDHELLLLMRNGSEPAFKEIYLRYWEKLVVIGYYHTKNIQSAEEIVGDVLFGLWQKRSTLEIHSLSPYLATAVKYSVFKAIHRAKRREELLEGRGSGAVEVDDETEKRLEARFLQEFVEGIVEKLPEKTRLVFRLSREEQLTTAEIAGKIQLSPQSVEYHITRALKALREQIRKFNIFSF